MRKTTGVIGAVVVIVMVAGAALPWYAGKRIEQEFRHGVDELSASAPVALTHYDRGWLSSEAVTEVTIDTEDGSRHLDIHHHITHGPRLFGWARIDSTPDFGEAQSLVAHYFGDQPALQAVTTVGFGNEIISDWHSPAIDDTEFREAPGVRIAWGGLEGHYQLDGNHTETRLSLPALNIRGNGVTMEINNLKLESEGPGGADWPDTEPFWGGQFSTTLTRLNYQDKVNDIALQMGLDGQGHLRDNGDDGLALASSWQLSNFKMDTASLSEPLIINNATQTLALQRLPREETRQLLSSLSNLDSALDDAQLELQAQQMMAQYIMAAIKGSPSLEVTIAGLDTPQGSMEGKLSVGFSDDNAVDRAVPPSDLSRGTLTLDAAADRTLLEQIVARSDASVAPEQMLQGLEQEGLLQRDGQRYRMDIHLDSRDLRINGQSHPEFYMMLPLLLMSLGH